jgi:DNA repair exonuclease SbcCD ATPase subunit
VLCKCNLFFYIWSLTIYLCDRELEGKFGPIKKEIDNAKETLEKVKGAKSEIQGLIEKSKAADGRLAKAKEDIENYDKNEKKLKEQQAENKRKEDELNEVKVVAK